MNGAVFSLGIFSIPLGYLTLSYSVSRLLSHRFIHEADIFEFHLCFTTAFQVEEERNAGWFYLAGGTDPRGQIVCVISAPLTSSHVLVGFFCLFV